jgi:hypothetical protein
MPRLLMTVALLAVAACQASPPQPAVTPPAPAVRPTDVELPAGGAIWAADKDASPASERVRFVPSGSAVRASRWQDAIPDDRPSWLPDAPEDPERYIVPDEWYSDSIAALR